MARVGDAYRKAGIELRCGPYQDVLADVETCDAVITDPPYSDRTHDGARSANAFRNYDKRPDRIQNIIVYDRITEEWARSFVESWAPRVGHWFIAFGDHVSHRWWESAAAHRARQGLACRLVRRRHRRS